MMKTSLYPTTGIEGLDTIIDHLRLGDNVVWQVDNIDDYAFFVNAFVWRAIEDKKKIIYVKFAQHKALLSPAEGITQYELDAKLGFESFSTHVHGIIAREGIGAYYVFDCLSDLLSAWATDLMIGNFFRITCPYLFQLDTIAFFGLIRSRHSYKTVARIRETTQLLMDVYNTGTDMYVHPLKVLGRYSPTMFLPHKKDAAAFIPVTSSIDLSKLTSYITGKSNTQAKRNLDSWDRLFMEVQDLLRRKAGAEDQEKALEMLSSVMIGREKRILALAKKTLSLQDLLAIKERVIGTGYIGGKAAGMLIARKILLQDHSFDWSSCLEPHDSFYIGSDVFYTYIVANGWWSLLMQHKTPEGYFEAAGILKDKMLEGVFPEEIDDQFWELIEYFGQSPIIVRSSSLLEDAFGNAFAGKYESIFCVNQGAPEQRFKRFKQCVREVFASTMGEDALTYRKQRGLDQQDEQMALLVQRVSGSHHQRYFFPDLGGVGISYNAFVWKPDMDPKAGMLRLVLGLGTRAVNRVENDYPRIVPLDTPLLRPHAGLTDTRKYSQRYVDVLNVEKNELETVPLDDVVNGDTGIDFSLFGMRDSAAVTQMRERGIADRDAWLLTFDPLLSESPFAGLMRAMLKRLEDTYRYPVDTEFTVNFAPNGQFQINLVQCRPLQTKGVQARVHIPESIRAEDIFFSSSGNFMGGNVMLLISRVISVDPEGYSRLSLSEKYDIARLIGRLNRQIIDKRQTQVMLIGPGRWGTSTPALGVPVRFAEINNISVMVEIEYMGDTLMPELSFGTHFFQDLVETDIFYAALFLSNKQAELNTAWLNVLENRLVRLLPESAKYEHIVRVFDTDSSKLFLMSDILSQKVICLKRAEN
jgi:hypothetical protein